MLPTEAAFFFAFLGILFAGAIPVPIYPPFRRVQVEDHLRYSRNAEARVLVTDEEIGRVGALLRGLVESLEQVVTAAELGRGGMLAPHSFSTPEAAPATRRALCCRMLICWPTSVPWGKRSR